MRWYLVLIFAYLLAMVQTTLFVPRLLGLNLFGVAIRPDLLLVLAVFMALRADPALVFIAAWCLGLAEDLTLDVGPLGVTALLFAVSAWLVCLIRPVLVASRILTQVLLCLVVVLAVRLPQQVLLFWLCGQPIDGFFTLQRGFGDALYSAVLGPYLFWFLAKTVEKNRPFRP